MRPWVALEQPPVGKFFFPGHHSINKRGLKEHERTQPVMIHHDSIYYHTHIYILYSMMDGNTPYIYPCNLTWRVANFYRITPGWRRPWKWWPSRSPIFRISRRQGVPASGERWENRKETMGFTFEISWNMTEIWIWIDFCNSRGGSWNFLLQPWYHYGWQTPFAEHYSVQWELVFFLLRIELPCPWLRIFRSRPTSVNFTASFRKSTMITMMSMRNGLSS